MKFSSGDTKTRGAPALRCCSRVIAIEALAIDGARIGSQRLIRGAFIDSAHV